MKSSLGAIVGTLVVGCLAAGCVPPASGGTGSNNGGGGNGGTVTPTTAASTPPTSPSATNPGSPVIDAFSATTTAAASPLTTALRWTIHDPGGDALTCTLDLDGNGSVDVTISPCTSDSSRTRTFTAVGTNAVTLAVTDGGSTTASTIALNVAAPSADQYSVTLRFTGTMTGGQTAAFTTAAAKWASIIKTGQPDRTVSIGADYCTSGTAAYSGVVDDLLIDAQIVPIDGAGGILGQAGPCLVRASNGLPLYGIMQFDSADVTGLESSGQLANTIIHEMGHIVGIGTVWTNKSVLADAGTSNPTYTGPAAIGAWRELGGSGNVPVENGGGPGTADSHWRETTFRTELMTGYLNSSNQLSAMTAASLADLGYGVDIAGADAYSLPALRAASVQADGVHDHNHEDFITVLPIGSA